MTIAIKALRFWMPVVLAGSLAIGCDNDDGGDEPGNVNRDASVRSDASVDGGTRPATDASAGLDASGGGGMDATVVRDASTDAAVLSPGEIIGLLQVVNDGEIAAGSLAGGAGDAGLTDGKAQNGSVEMFARMMVTMHSAAKARQLALGTPADSPQASTLRTMIASVQSQLMAAPAGPSFDLLYISSQVTMHAQTLSLINDVLLPSATGALQAELMTARTEVQMHLTDATNIRNSLADGGVPANDAGSSGDGGARDAATGGDAAASDGGSDAAR